MGFIKYDSPVMVFIGKVADFIVLNFLWIFCSIPVITIGAATSAKYAGAMRIVRQEEGSVFKSFFKDFKENFKQATILWMGLFVVIAVVALDWYWLIMNGIWATKSYYKIAIVLLTCIVTGVYMTMFAFIAKFEVTNKEAIKASIIMAIVHIIKLSAIALLEIGTFIAAFWYARWMPAVLLFGTTTAFYFTTITLVKDFKKLEDHFLGEDADTSVVEKESSKVDTADTMVVEVESSKEDRADAVNAECDSDAKKSDIKIPDIKKTDIVSSKQLA